MPHLRYMYDDVHLHVQYSMHSTYCYDVVCSLVIWSLYFSSATCRFVVLSLASNTVKTHDIVFSMEFGLGVLASWNDILNEEPPLSPPTFTHTSSLGIMPSCQVSRWTLDWKVVYLYTCEYLVLFVCAWSMENIYVVMLLLYLLFCSRYWKTKATRSGTKTRGADTSLLLHDIVGMWMEPPQIPSYPPEYLQRAVSASSH